MSPHPTEAVLQMHLDGDLSGQERWRIEAHLRECPECARSYAAIRDLVGAVAELPDAVEPPLDLWPEIAARVRASGRTVGVAPESAARRRLARPILSWSVAIAAALMVGIGLGRLLPTAEPTLATITPEWEATAVLASYDEPMYDQAIADLQLILAGLHDRLRPETIAAIEENLAIIDRAIGDSRAALLEDPANDHLHRHLTANMQAKLELLRMVTSAVAAQL